MSRHVICSAEELPEGAHRIVEGLGPIALGVYNVAGSYVAVRNACPHAGAPLCLGVVTGAALSDAPPERVWAHDGQILKCPWHGWEFKLPEGVTLTDPPMRVKTFPAFVEDGMVVVDLAPARPAAAVK